MFLRAKFKLESITRRLSIADGKEKVDLSFKEEVDASIAVAERISVRTSYGSLVIESDNPAVFEKMKLGQNYFLDIVSAE